MTQADLELIAKLVDTANQRSDGHLTIMKFTTNWRVAFSTPFEREHIDEMPVGSTFQEAAEKALASLPAMSGPRLAD